MHQPIISRRKLRIGSRTCRLFILAAAGLTIASFQYLIVLHNQLEVLDDRPFFVAHQLSSSQENKVVTKNEEWPPTLNIYTESVSSHDIWYEDPNAQIPKPKEPLPRRITNSRDLTKHEFSQIKFSSAEIASDMCQRIPSLLPIDDFGTSIKDPYLPWIHDVFLSHDKSQVNILAQNRRRCHTGENHLEEMKYWEGQLALFQPLSLKRLANATNYNLDDTVQYRISSHKEADEDALETRFRCRFKLIDYTQHTVTYQGETLSTYPFNYEFVNWRKKKSSMLEDGKEQSFFWLSPLMFHCPIPEPLLEYVSNSQLLFDIVPIRTPPRRNDRDGFYFHEGHGGPMTFNSSKAYGNDYILPNVENSGRWENLPICPLKIFNRSKEQTEISRVKDDLNTNASNSTLHRLVACTWTSALHQRRGNERRISDGKSRLHEWITFHLEAGFDHMYIFDNTGANPAIFRLKNEVDSDLANAKTVEVKDDLGSVTDRFPASKVTRIHWPATICNNNRPAHDDPGERSSQYAAEASCRMRYDY